MALPASDAFNQSYGAMNSGNWTTVGTTYGMVFRGDGTIAAEEANSCSRWNADTFSADQYAETGNHSAGWTWTNGGIGPAVRCSSSANTYYGYRANHAGGSIIKAVAGTVTTLNTDTTAWTTGDTVRLEVTGTSTTTLVVKQNGTQVATVNDSSSPITDAGQAGVCGHLSSGQLLVTSWAANNLGSSTVVPVFMAQYRQRMR